jgi:hypothetical protein
VYTCSFLLKGMLSEEKEEKAAGLAHYFSRMFRVRVRDHLDSCSPHDLNFIQCV